MIYNQIMAKMILVDFDTALSSPAAKNAVIEAVVGEPDSVITVLNANNDMTLQESKLKLREASFPFDVVTCNPLPSGGSFSKLDFKTMFASRIQAAGQEVALAIDDDVESQRMWNSSINVK